MMYTCHMAAGMAEMERQCAVGGHNKTAAVFVEVFARPFKPSTYSDNLAIWKKIPKEELDVATQAGQTAAGEWGLLAKRYGKKRA